MQLGLKVKIKANKVCKTAETAADKYSLSIGFTGVTTLKKVMLALYNIVDSRVPVFLKYTQRKTFFVKVDIIDSRRDKYVELYSFADVGNINSVNIVETIRIT